MSVFPVKRCWQCLLCYTGSDVRLWKASRWLIYNLRSLLTEARVPDSEKPRRLVLSGCLVLLHHISMLHRLLEQEFFLLSGITQEVAEFVPFLLMPWGSIWRSVLWHSFLPTKPAYKASPNPSASIYTAYAFPSLSSVLIFLSGLNAVSDSMWEIFSLQKEKIW